MNKKNSIILILFFISVFAMSQENKSAFKSGEYLKFKMSYSGFLKAGNATLSIDSTTLNGKKVFHAIGKGWTTGIIKWFFTVEDDYQTYFDKNTGKPYLFKRKINEGGYKKNVQITFDYKKNIASVKNKITKKDTVISIGNIQDMISCFYYLRNQDVNTLKPNDEITLNIFMDERTYLFKLYFLGNEILKTHFGKIKTLKFRPLVQQGRVFKQKESVTIWITADDNKIPIKFKASLSVGSLSAELESYRGLANPFEIIYEDDKF